MGGSLSVFIILTYDYVDAEHNKNGAYPFEDEKADSLEIITKR